MCLIGELKFFRSKPFRLRKNPIFAKTRNARLIIGAKAKTAVVKALGIDPD
jgi:hypothetical protein